MTATADADYSHLIAGSCCLSPRVRVVTTASDRPNIRLSVFHTGKGPNKLSSLSWIVDGLKEQGVLFPKTIIYCRTVPLVGNVFAYLLQKLDHHAYTCVSRSAETRLIGMYHGETIARNKELVLKSLTTDNGSMRVTIATSSLGCGVDCKDVIFIVHLGVPFDLADYVQQIGRAGRGDTSMQCHAILYKVPSSSKKVNKNIVDYCKSNSCLRSVLFTPFNENRVPVKALTPAHRCCSKCAQQCLCLDGKQCRVVYPFDVAECVVDINKAKVRDVSDYESFLVRSLISDYIASVCCYVPHMFSPVGSVSGLPSSLVDEIINELPFIGTIDDVIDVIGTENFQLAEEVLLICSEVFGDITFHNFGSISSDKRIRQHRPIFSYDGPTERSENSDFDDAIFDSDESEDFEDLSKFFSPLS